jgi:SAM-dependent methyltransferase
VVVGSDFYFKDGDDCPLLVALQPEVIAAGTRLAVSRRDEMFRHFHYGRGEAWDLALHLYLESGKKIWRTFRRVLEWHFGDLSRVGLLLDFAAGYGRVTRFLVTDLPAERVSVAEIEAEAVRFQEETFGVAGLLSTVCPEEFAPGREFDAVLVSSLFTHLPEERFAAWLAKLLSLVRPGGLLAFSLHDRSLLPEAGAAEFTFRPESESGSLAKSEYGSTWVSEGYVRARIARIAEIARGEEVAVHRIPRGLANYQDLYVVTKGNSADPAALAALRGGAEGYIESCTLSAARRLTLRGWVADRFTRQPVQEVRAFLDGRPVPPSHPLWERPEIAQVFPGDVATGQGFQVDVDLPPGRPTREVALRLVAIGADGFEAVLYAGTAEAALLQVALTNVLNLSRENEMLKYRIAGMRASRFWKLRDRWFALKRWLGMTDEA